MSTSTEIRTDTTVLTLINVFTVDSDKQDHLVRLLEQTTEKVMRHRQRFVSANIHRGLDGVTVANYAQWASQADFDAMLADPVAGEHMREIATFAEFRPGLYEVASVHRR